MLCVHGNPTWSYLWRRFLAEAPRGLAGGGRRPARHGVLRAPGARRARLAQRVDDLTAVVDALDVTGPVVTVGARLGRRDLARLGVGPPRPAARPSCSPTPPSTSPPTRPRRRSSGWPAPRRCGTRSARPRRRSSAPPAPCPGPRCPPDVRDAFAAPYAHGGQAARRRRVRRRHPARAEHVSAPTLDGIAAGVRDAGRRAGAAAVGAARPGLLRPLPARPARAAAARATSTATSGPRTSSPRTRRDSAVDAVARGCRAGTRRPPPRRPAACRPAAGLGRAGGARRRPGRRRRRARGRPPHRSRSTCWSAGCASSPRGSPPRCPRRATGSRCSCRPAPT